MTRDLFIFKASLAFIIVILLLIAGCAQHKPNEKEDALYWETTVIQPAHKVLYQTHQTGPALAVYDSLLDATGRTSPYVQAGRFILQADYHLFLTKNFEATSQYVDSALSIYQSQHLRRDYARAYVGLLIFGGEMAFRTGNYTKSNNYFFEAKQASDQYLDPCDRSGFTYNVAMVAYRQQNYAQSAAYFKEAYASQSTCRIQTTAIVLQQQEIQSNIGLCMIKLKKYDSALAYFNHALQIADQYKDSLGSSTMEKIRGVVYGNMAKVYDATRQPAKAEELFKKSITLNVRPGYEQKDAMLNQLQLAELYANQHRLNEMFSLLHDVRQGLDTIPDNNGQVNWLRLMARYYKEKDQPLNELTYFKRYDALRDSSAEIQKQIVQADVGRQLKDKEQALQIAALTRNNHLNRLYLWAALAFVAMAGIIIFLIYQTYRRSKKNVKVLTQLNEEIKHQKTALEKANKEKDRILNVVAHDLRNPIGLTAYVSDLILMEERNEKDRANLQMIKEASQQALNLTNELLGLNADSKDAKKEEMTALHALLETGVQLHRYKAAEKGQQIVLEKAIHEMYIDADPDKLNRVLNNLLTNAIKFSPIQGQILVSLEKEGKQALLKIEDNGIGIPEEEQETVFARFSSYRRKGTSGERSYGLGLSISREIIEEHGGSITLQSKKNKGTTFFVRLPLADNV
jgi:two-component system, OmpR family, sensor histidine kinase VicK